MASPLLHSTQPLRRRWFNRAFALLYALALSLLLFRHFHKSPSPVSIALFLADFVLAFMWATSQAFHLNPVRRRVFPENLPPETEYPALDVLICTADPVKEPPMGVVNTALSVMAYDYPSEKLSVYVSDDGGSAVTLSALREAAEFARRWVAYCKKYDVVDRSPEVYFEHDHAWFPETREIKIMYENMKSRVESGDLRTHDNIFTRQDHTTLIQILSESGTDNDVTGRAMPSLIYVSREKNKHKPHNFKAGALNVLLRVSGYLTNAPIVLTLDCDMYSNDPKTPLRALCYFLDPNTDPNLGWVQFPQRFHGINTCDIYASEFKFETQILSLGMDGLLGVQFMGTGGFFKRYILCPDIKNVNATFDDKKPKDVLASAYDVASCKYEENTEWGSEIGFRYGSLAEDTYTSYRLHCEGWKSVFCHPERAAFLGDAPCGLNDALTQAKRWYVGFLEIFFSRYCPMIFGIRSMNPLQALCYTYMTLHSFWSIPVIVYVFLPQISLVRSLQIFPEVSELEFFLYAFLFIGAYGKDFLDFVVLGGGSVRQLLNYERMWVIWGLSSYPFALLEWALKSLGKSTVGFNVTGKVTDEEQSKRYARGVFEFGVTSPSPLLLTLSVASLFNLLSFVQGVFHVLLNNGRFEEMFVQMFIAGVVVVQSRPVYEAMVLRNDNGKMPLKITLTSATIALVMYLACRWVVL